MSEDREVAGKGERVAHFRIIERIGAGGMGVVYRARDEKLGREVALKFLPGDAAGDPAAHARLVREARTAATLNHPGICTIHEIGESEGRTFIAMELVAGRPLSELIPAGGLPADRVAGYGLQITEALAHAHEHGVIHRDLKAANVIVTATDRVKVLDFGLAKNVAAMAAPTEVTLTETGVIAGTPPYLAPEVLRGRPADARADVWALGVLLHEMASGARPFSGESGWELAGAILNAPPAILPGSVPAGLEAVIQRCLTKDPEMRYQRASEVHAALEAIGARPPAPVATPLWRRARFGWAAVAAAAISIVALAVIDPGGLRERLVPGAGRIHSLAVLPLKNLSHDPEQEYFVDAMTDELGTALATSLEGARVTSITSAMRYKNASKPIPQIAHELGVDAVLEGSVLRVGNRVRINVQLVDGQTDRHLWAHSYERELSDVLALQVELAKAIADPIRTTLSAGAGTAAAAPAVDEGAYDAYLRARVALSLNTPEGIRGSIAQFREALRLDPKFALAWAGLSQAYGAMGFWMHTTKDTVYPESKRAALEALRLDNRLAEAHLSLSRVLRVYEWDLEGAEKEMRRAIELNPSLSQAHRSYSNYLADLGRFDQGLSHAEQALRLDPLSLEALANRAFVLCRARRFDEAITQLHEVAEMAPSNPIGPFNLAVTCATAGRYGEAIDAFAKWWSLMGGPVADSDSLRASYAREGTRGFWRELLAIQDRRHAFPAYWVGLCYGQVGELDQAMTWLERSAELRESHLLGIRTDSLSDPLLPSPRFHALLRRMHLEA